MVKKHILLFLILIVLMAFSTALPYLSSAGVLSITDSSNSSSRQVSSIIPVVSDSRDAVELPILMYHGITDVSASVDEYTILAETFENDLKWLGDNGFTSISVKQLINYVDNGSALPEKPVLITFDDGYVNNYNFALPLLEKYHMKAVISIIGKKADESSGDMYRNISNSSLSWGEIALLSASENIEIGSHTYYLHDVSGGRKGADKKAGESQEEYEKILKDDLSMLQNKLYDVTGKTPLLFAWPYGAYPNDGSADEVLKELGFRVSVTSYQKSNTIEKGNPNCLLELKRFLRTPDFYIGNIIC